MQNWKSAILAVVVLLLSVLGNHALQAEYDNIKQTDLSPVRTITATAGATGTSATFKPLARSTTQSAMITGTGTSPNFKVELLVSLDEATFVKPETGGDLGTFTDQLPHIVAISVPLSPGGHQFKVTELGGVNPISVAAQEASQ